jgi:uncharacterized protein (TIGR02302 family)
MDRKASPGAFRDPAFERKIWRARIAGAFEQAWLRLWLVLAVLCLFLVVSFAGIWPYLGFWAHVGLLGLFGAGLIASVVHIARVNWPTREDGIRRIEAVSGVPHRPVSSYEDTITGGASDPTTQAIWQAHRARMAALFARLKSGNPRPRTDRFDPMALRAGLVLIAVVLTLMMGDRARERIESAFVFPAATALAETRLDAWITPPPYTSRPPVMLTDGAATGNKSLAAGEGDHSGPPDVPQKSVLIVRAGGIGSSGLSVEITPAGSQDESNVEHREPEAKPDSGGDLQEIRYELNKTATVRALAGGTELAKWRINVTPDKPPQISLSRPPELTPRGSLKLTYKAEDDYGVTSAKVNLEKAKAPPPDPARDWAKPEPLSGPRPPLQRPPELPLKLTKPNAKSVDGRTYFDFASHPWAGHKVILTLEATDVAGQTGRSVSFEMILPERNFTKPLARAVVEQRRKLMDDPRYRGSVMKALDALTLEPDGFIDDLKIYLGLRTVYHRLERDRTRAGMKSVVDQMWQIALRIEDGSLSDAERALKDAQDKLSKALEDGASDEEIKQLMQELKQAFNEYMKQLAQQNGQEQQPEGSDQQNQVLGQEDLERMMRNLEDMAKNGSREQAQQMLSEMQDLMERLQSNRMDQAQQQRNQEMLQMMDELGNMVGDQQKLLDDTFSENRGDEEEGGQQGQGQKPPPGMKGMGGDGQEGKNGAPPGTSDKAQQGRGQRGKGGQAQQGQGDQMGQGQQQGGKGQLSQRQRELKDRLGKLQQQMREKGAGAGGSPNKLSEAEKAMEEAENALEQGDLDEATSQQGRALEQMRQGAQSMAQEMMRNMPQRYGQSGDTPRDPLGRPQKSQGPDLGTSVKVPDQIDIQRAREILEELRRRLGESTRVPQELDYLERLLRRF